MIQFTKDTASEKYNIRLQTIFNAASEIFAEKGYHQASIRNIAKATGVSLGHLYYYFSNKEELLYKISLNCFESVKISCVEKLESVTDSEERLLIFIENHVSYFVNHLNEMKILAHESDSLTGDYNEEILEIKRAYISILESIVTEINPKITDPTIIAFSIFGMMNWIYTWYNPKVSSGISQIVETIFQMAISGIKNFELKKN